MSLTNMQQEYLNNCNHRWNVKTGATGSGKSFVDYAYVIPKRLVSLRGEGLAVMLGNTRGTLERNILEPMREIWGTSLVGNVKSDNTVNLFGKKVYCLGADNKKHIARIQGATIEYAYGDEVTTWDEGVFEMLKSRLRCDHSHFDGTCNPANPQHWFKKFLDGDADIFQQAYNIDDGCLSAYVVEELKKEYAGTVFYGRYIEGLWINAEGLVFDMFNTDEHVQELKDDDLEGEIYVSADYGIQNATVFLIWQKVRGEQRWHCVDEYYYSGRDQKKQKTVAELVQGLKDTLNGRSPRQVIVDPSATALVVELRKNGLSVVHADNDVLNGIADVCSMLRQDKLSFSPRCKHTIEEFGLYSWDSKSIEDRPIKENDHCMDAIRYFVKTKRLLKKLEEVKPYKSYL